MSQTNEARDRKTNWLAQFGLYRDHGETEKSPKKSWKPTLGLYFILGCSILLILAVFFILQELFVEHQEIIEFPSFDRPTIFPTEATTTTEFWSNTTVHTKISENNTEILPEKLIRTPSKYLKPPPPPRRRSLSPRPFDFELHEPVPSAFKKSNGTVTRVNNIQDILAQLREPAESESSGNRRMHISGVYRSPPRKRIYRPPRRTTIMPITRTTERNYDVTTNSPLGDPFYNYKPQVPSEVNLMATKQFRFAPYLYKSQPSASRGNIPFYHYATESTGEISGLYQDIISSEKNRQKGNQEETGGKKPFSLMLDIYPVTTDDEFKSLNRKPNLANLDTSSYYSSMNFPQIPQMHQMSHNLYHNMYFRGPFGVSPTRDYHRWTYPPEPTSTEDSVNKPSSMIVHLNLYPKNKKRLSRTDSDIQRTNENEAADTFQPLRPKVVYNSKPLDEQMEPELEEGTAIEIPKAINPYSSTTIYYPNATSYVEIVKSIDLSPSAPPSPYPDIPTGWAGVSSSIPPAIDVYPKSERGNRLEIMHPRGTMIPDISTVGFTITDNLKVHNSQQPDNPMVVAVNKHNAFILQNADQYGNFDITSDDLIRFDSKDAIQRDQL
ncbi:hypothetical protein DMENIID0001_157920 [Sergentomyia squamirostris]